MKGNTNRIAGVIALIVIFGAAYFFTRPTHPSPAEEATQVAATTTSSETPANGTVKGTSGNTVTIGSAVAPTDYARPLTYPSSISEHDKAAIQTRFDADVASIKATNDLDTWGDLAVLRKIVQDYKGSAEIFIYLSKRAPQYPGPFASLGDLYSNYLKDYPKAEANYLKALSIEPKFIDGYLSLFTMYRTTYPKSNTAPEDILKQGIAANPASYQMQIELARYYVTSGRIADAKAMYIAAAANARTQGKTQIATQIQTDADNVK